MAGLRGRLVREASRATLGRPATKGRSVVERGVLCRTNRVSAPGAGYSGSGTRPASSPAVRHTAGSHGLTCWWPQRSTHARTASMIASTASPSSLPAGVTAPISGSGAHAHLAGRASWVPMANHERRIRATGPYLGSRLNGSLLRSGSTIAENGTNDKATRTDDRNGRSVPRDRTPAPTATRSRSGSRTPHGSVETDVRELGGNREERADQARAANRRVPAHAPS